MTDQLAPEIASLRRCVPLRDLSDTLVAKVALLSKGVLLAEGARLEIKQNPEAPFYMVLEGKVKVEPGQPKDPDSARILKQGEFFGANALLYGKSLGLTVVALEPTRLIMLDVRLLAALMQQEPELKNSLQQASTMYRRVHSKHFRWVDAEENVQVILREHPFYLLVGLAQGSAIILLGLFIPLLVARAGSIGFTTLAAGFGSVVVGLGILWGLWQYIDWQNDYFVVTDRRIAWIERIVILYDSRNEILLSELRSVEPETDFLGRILGYANLYIKDNFQRVIIFKNIGHHLQIKKAIETLAMEAKVRQAQVDRTKLEQKMREWITSPPQPPPGTLFLQPTTVAPPKAPLRQRLHDYFDFRMRLKEGNTIIYRRHVLFLFYRVAPGLLLGLAGLLGTPLLIYTKLSAQAGAGTILSTLLLGAVLLVGCALWVFYQYEDWRNDTYHITPEKILSRQKKPLDIDRRMELALLVEDQEQVIGLEYRRSSILGMLLNYGEVSLSVKIPAEVQVRKMRQVYDPAQVQQDIFDRIYHRKRKKAQEELRKSEQLKDYFAAYHQVAGSMKNPPNREEYPPDFEVK